MSHLPPRKRMDLREFWFRHLLAWQDSDMNQREYCEVYELPLKRFGNWRATLRPEMPPPPKRLLYRRSCTLRQMPRHMPSKDIGAVSPGYIPPPPVSPPPGRRYFSSADKRNIVAEIERPGETVSAVARRYGITKRLLFKWKKAYGPKPEPVIVPVTIIDEGEPIAVARSVPAPGIEITLKSGHHMRVPADVNPKAVSALLNQLESTSS